MSNENMVVTNYILLFMNNGYCYVVKIDTVNIS